MPATYYIPVWRSMPPLATALGNVTFAVSPDDASVTDYFANVYAAGTTSPIRATQDFGRPIAVGGMITVNMAVTLNALPAGDYEVKIGATSAGGTTLSAASFAFSVPLE